METVFYHGGHLDKVEEVMSFAKGKFEYGPGLYITDHRETAEKYAKGGRKLYQVMVKDGKDMNSSFLPMDSVRKFVNRCVIGRNRKEVLSRLEKYVNVEGNIKSYLLDNILMNEKAVKGANLEELRLFYVSNGIDYSEVINGETMLVVYNPKIIESVKKIIR